MVMAEGFAAGFETGLMNPALLKEQAKELATDSGKS